MYIELQNRYEIDYRHGSTLRFIQVMCFGYCMTLNSSGIFLWCVVKICHYSFMCIVHFLSSCSKLISLTSLLVVKMLTVVVSTISNSQVFLLQKCESHFFSKYISVYATFNDQSFNDMLTNDILVLNNWALVF